MTYNPPSIDDYIDKITDYIEYYPNVVDPKLCNTIIKHFDKNAKHLHSLLTIKIQVLLRSICKNIGSQRKIIILNI